MQIAQAVEAEAEADSIYRQIRRFLKNENKVAIDYRRLLKLEGKWKIIIDRTKWKFGAIGQYLDFERRLQKRSDSADAAPFRPLSLG